MKFYQDYALVVGFIIGALSEVQGNHLTSKQAFKSRKQEDSKAAKLLKEGCTKLNLPSTESLTQFRKPGFKENANKIFHRNKAIRSTGKVFKVKNSVLFSKSLKTNYWPITKASYSQTTTKNNFNTNLPLQLNFRSDKIYCRQITRIEKNSQGEIINNIQHICGPQSARNQTQYTTKASTIKPRGNLLFATTKQPQRINCRRVMNSEFNEQGEIVDSVTEVCDPPTTTTTTTKRPTTRKPTTTTAKPLVKICWPVMDSYLNEEGKIIDSVTTFCKMQPVN